MKKEYNKDYEKIVYEIIIHEEFQKRKTYEHHGDISVYKHSLKVSKLAYKITIKFKFIDSESIAIGGLLHDFYYEPWKENKKKTSILKKHGFIHAQEALDNSNTYFPHLINKKVENIILRHMFPLNIVPPKYIESWIISFCDKIVSIEVFLKPKEILMLLGIKKKKE